jgi:hypothetical protein
MRKRLRKRLFFALFRNRIRRPKVDVLRGHASNTSKLILFQRFQVEQEGFFHRCSNSARRDQPLAAGYFLFRN